MTPREILNERRGLETELRAIERQIERTLPEGAPRGAGAVRYEERMPSTNMPEGAAYQRVEAYEAELLRLREEKAALLMEAERQIERLSDKKARIILRYYYCLAWTDRRIAEELEYEDDRTICKMRNSAVDWLNCN